MNPDNDRTVWQYEKRKEIGIFLFFAILCCFEFYQFFIIKADGQLYGDFFSPLLNEDTLPISLLVSILTWVFAYTVYWVSRTEKKPKLEIDTTWPILLIYFLNLILTVTSNVGHVQAATKSGLSILTTIIPINYLILVNAAQAKLNKKFHLAALIFVVIDLYRLLLGATLKVAYISLTKWTRKKLFFLVILSPILIVLVQQLIEYKNDARGIKSSVESNLLINTISSRITLVPTIHYIASNSADISNFCTQEEYATVWKSAALSVLPKNLLGIDWPKTYNNCLIEYHLKASVDDSSVNFPWLMSLYVASIHSLLDFIAMFTFTAGLLLIILKASNSLLGRNGAIFKAWIVYEYFGSGNILHLTIPLYFLTILFIYSKLKQKDKGVS
ncbi:oligosaccharide repeat unit polymerase [Chromobacterium vaccinii]|uniref:oligosaccharide repeat unit polymerase n=1 Tax=Chromobacterium vaccinii TaxID=1108595 RepID=UPI001E4D345E|nr:oligosaccharide repeat unit polymerase [Chromobacterium vaccinii]MCD4486437.1 oligosaccharide repeat unit polymerase [Chromobacterium vaccinii]